MLIDIDLLNFAISKCKGERDGRVSENDAADIIDHLKKHSDHGVAIHTAIAIYNTLNFTDSAKDLFLCSMHFK